MLDMYKGVANSPETTITNDINNLDTIIYVLDETRIPELPNIMVLGNGISSETVKILSIAGNALTVERAFQGVARSWNAGTLIARNFTEYDYRAVVENIEGLEGTKTTLSETEAITGLLASLTTTEKENLVGAINELKLQSNDIATHIPELVTQSGGVHGMVYEEGTWTPELKFGGNNTGITYNRRFGRFTRVNNKIFVDTELLLTSVGSATGDAIIDGLPFVSAVSPNISSVSNVTFERLNIGTDGLNAVSIITPSASRIILKITRSDISSPTISNVNFKNDTILRIQGFYTI